MATVKQARRLEELGARIAAARSEMELSRAEHSLLLDTISTERAEAMVKELSGSPKRTKKAKTTETAEKKTRVRLSDEDIKHGVFRLLQLGDPLSPTKAATALGSTGLAKRTKLTLDQAVKDGEATVKKEVRGKGPTRKVRYHYTVVEGKLTAYGKKQRKLRSVG